MKFFYAIALLLLCLTNSIVLAEEPDKILLLGDSITRGEPYTYRFHLDDMLTTAGYSFDFIGTLNQTNPNDHYPAGWDTDHEGHFGHRTELIDQEINTWLANYSFDTVLIHLGTNDVIQYEAGEGSLAQSVTNMESIIAKLRADNPNVIIYLAQILPFGESQFDKAEMNGYIDAWNAELVTVASSNSTGASPITLVDINSGFTDADVSIHPDESGAIKMAERWAAALLGTTIPTAVTLSADSITHPTIIPQLFLLLATLLTIGTVSFSMAQKKR